MSLVKKQLDSNDITAREARAFWSKVSVGDPDECWTWLGTISGNGYGIYKTAAYGIIGAHRLALLLASKQPLGNLTVHHSCRNPCCCNPRHLSASAHKDNINEMIQRNLSQGNLPFVRKLTDEQYNRIAILYSTGKYTQLDLARRFGVSQPLINYIVRGGKTANAQMGSSGPSACV